MSSTELTPGTRARGAPHEVDVVWRIVLVVFLKTYSPLRCAVVFKVRRKHMLKSSQLRSLAQYSQQVYVWTSPAPQHFRKLVSS